MSRHVVKKHRIDGVIALLLFGVFAACVLLVLLTGTDVYRKLTERNQESYDQRTGIQYVATKVRQAELGTDVSVGNFDGIETLTFSEEIDGDTYVTRIYCHEGWIKELFAYEGGDFDPEDGEKIIEAQSLDVGLDDGLLSIDVVDENGSESQLALALRGEEATG